MDTASINQLRIEDLSGRRVLVRIDVDDGEFLARDSFSPWRLQACLPTLKYLLQTESRIILATQLGDPAGQWQESLILDPLAEELSLLLNHPIRKLSEAVGTEVFRAVMDTKPHDIVLLENLGFYPGELTNDSDFARQLGALAEIYCNEAFAVADRARASNVGITRFIPISVAGLEMAREISMAEAVIDYPDPPFVALIAGARLEQKLPLLEQLCPKVNRLFIGGALSFTFMKAQKQEVGAAPVDEELLPLVERFLAEAEGKTEIILPGDFVVVDSRDWKQFERGGRRSSPPPFAIVAAKDLLPSHVPVDIGQETLRRIGALIEQARTLLWNGPLGIWEVEPFGAGTREVAWRLVSKAAPGFRGMLCGDSLGHALRSSGLPLEQLRQMTPAGQAMLQLLAGQPLPAVEALMKEADFRLSANRQPRRVLLPVDGSEESLEVVRRTASLLNVNGTEIHLLFVQKSAPLTADGWAKPEQRRRREIQSRLEGERVFALSNTVLARYGAISHRQTILQGDLTGCILKYADEIGADLVAIGCRGPAGPLRKLLRNASYKIVEGTKCPVFVVRVPDDEEAHYGMAWSKTHG